MKSIWLAKTKMPSFSSLEGDRKTDVAIIGGGIAGILTAYMLKRRGVDCLVIEKKRICNGTTGHTTGKITVGQGLIYDKITQRYGKNAAQGYYLANCGALSRFREMAAGIDCHFEDRSNYIYSISNREKIEREVLALENIGASPAFCEKTNLPFDTIGAVRLPDQAQFNPLMFLGNIASQLEIYENSFAKKVKDGCIFCDRGTVSAENVVIATHFPFINTSGFYFLKLFQHRSYVLALEGADAPRGMYLDEAEDGFSFRDYGQYLLLGGGGHRTGKGGGCFNAVREVKERLYPAAEERYAFAAQDCMSLDRIPYIGRYSATRMRTFVATGFNKWGMCGAMVAAELLADEICGVKNDFARIFAPDRSILHPGLFINGVESVSGLLYPTTKRCPHLGCALHWNRAEHSWDCACHGSRFDNNGEIIDNPSQRRAKL